MNPGRFVGRVGALAVALGIGAAVATTGSAVASAAPASADGSDSGSGSGTDKPSGKKAVNSRPTTTGTGTAAPGGSATDPARDVRDSIAAVTKEVKEGLSRPHRDRPTSGSTRPRVDRPRPDAGHIARRLR